MSDLTPERLAELRRIAEEATQGEWSIVLGSGNNVCTWVVREHEDGSATFIADCLPEDDLAIEAAEKDHRPNMRHIAAFDPPTVLALLDEIERLRRERDMHRAGKSAALKACDEYLEKIERLRDTVRDVIQRMRDSEYHKHVTKVADGGMPERYCLVWDLCHLIDVLEEAVEGDSNELA